MCRILLLDPVITLALRFLRARELKNMNHGHNDTTKPSSQEPQPLYHLRQTRAVVLLHYFVGFMAQQ